MIDKLNMHLLRDFLRISIPHIYERKTTSSFTSLTDLLREEFSVTSFSAAPRGSSESRLDPYKEKDGQRRGMIIKKSA